MIIEQTPNERSSVVLLSLLLLLTTTETQFAASKHSAKSYQFGVARLRQILEFLRDAAILGVDFVKVLVEPLQLLQLARIHFLLVENQARRQKLKANLKENCQEHVALVAKPITIRQAIEF